ncbi:site-specific integrase [Candidatus Accumulibacter sp. ACC007]|uniref:tyrosine-type recombinase/integrase n=1 Tax=Candidatus Accumulibacter sp. ACC007 TaxID=2823333 RepID=UPI0025C3D575|nr:site-specific integrase [Candidatus Accumulibacter sp. ACC007]
MGAEVVETSKPAKRSHALLRLSAVNLASLGQGWHRDGGGLYLFVRGASRGWVFRYTDPDGKRRNMGLGGFPAVKLAVARKAAAKLQEQVKNPLDAKDPIADKQATRLRARLEKAKLTTFAQATAAYIEAKSPEWSNVKHVQQWENTLATYAFPILGELPVAAVDTALIQKVLAPIWTAKTETASRVRGRIESVLDWATTSGYRQGDNPARWRGHLENLLAAPKKVRAVEHHAALPFAQIAGFIAALRQREGFGARALELAVLTAARSGEIRGATWDEFDLPGACWTIPAGRMKAKIEHRVPLSGAAMALIKTLPRIAGADLVFPSAKGSPLSDATLGAVIKRMGYDVTAHGFRSSFRDWAGEVATGHARETIEHALAHQLKDKAEAAYARGTMFDKRRALMEDWARYCERGDEPKVLKLAKSA